MFGILLAGLSSAFSELSDSIGKKEVHAKAMSFYSFGFLNMLFGTAFLIGLGIVRHDFFFSLASLPTFIPRLALEILQAYVTVRAVVVADRGDFGLVKTITTPLLLVVDITLGYAITFPQVIGIFIIIVAVILLFALENIRMKGLPFLLIGGLNAVITISLYKYDVSHFNSVESEQSIIELVLMLYFFIFAVYKAKENPISFIRRPMIVLQTTASGLANVVGAYAILFAPASVITAGLRASAVLFSIVSGKFYFKERSFFLRLTLFLLTALGFLLLI